jgi:hypothetical protein
LLVDTHYAGEVVVFHFAVVGSVMLVAAFSDRALFARLLGNAKPLS